MAEVRAAAAGTVHRRDPAYWFDITVGRALPAMGFSVFVVAKLLLVVDAVGGLRAHPQPASLLNLTTQALGLAYFTLIVGLYVFRLPKKAGDGRPMMIFTSLFGSFSVLLVSWLPSVPQRQSVVLLSDLVVVVGMVYTLWALTYLRRSFSIMPQARRLITGGPYALSRHPLYLGEGLAAIGLTLPTVGWMGTLLIGLFLVAQFLRLQAEERVLTRAFPEYADYARRVPRYLPDPRPLLRLRSPRS